MKKILFVFVCSMMLGCAMTSEEVTEGSDLPQMTRRFISLRQVRMGMTRQEVASVLAFPIITGYELRDSNAEQYQPLTSQNPHRTETFDKAGHSYNIEYYLAGIEHQDDQIEDDELVPLVFKDDTLVGMGWDFVKKLKSE